TRRGSARVDAPPDLPAACARCRHATLRERARRGRRARGQAFEGDGGRRARARTVAGVARGVAFPWAGTAAGPTFVGTRMVVVCDRQLARRSRAPRAPA